MFGIIIILLIAGALVSIGYRLGWNAACKLYRDRTVDSAEKRYVEDIK